MPRPHQEILPGLPMRPLDLTLKVVRPDYGNWDYCWLISVRLWNFTDGGSYKQDLWPRINILKGKKNEKNFWDMEIIGNRQKIMFLPKNGLIN